MQKVGIIGAGAMGGLFGALLVEAGHDVRLLDISVEHVNNINQNGLTIESESRTRVVPITATTQPAKMGKVDLAVVFVKSYHTAAAAVAAAAILDKEGCVLTLQNGMGNADTIADAVNKKQVVAGTTSHGATFLSPGRIRHAGIGPTIVGPWDSRGSDKAAEIAGMFTRAGIETSAIDDVRRILWEKLLINVGINAITALTHIKNGEIIDQPATMALSRAAVEEAMAVAATMGIRVREDAVENVFTVARATAANRSSMGQDVDNRRSTEIHAINGAVVVEGGKIGVDTPVNKTLAALVETLQTHYCSGE
ncbi:MAG: 2-dehydropantoate 2-reductase [Desulfobacteraceae bacterium]|nr:2-dehydropantoate 2-reductase [Desulfobacteraceae bacterium]